MEKVLRDCAYALRGLWKSPGFAAVAVITLALGIGANTAIFTLVHAVMMQSLPVSNPSELYTLGDTKTCCDTTGPQENFALFSFALYKQVCAASPEFSDIAAFQSWLEGMSARRGGSSAIAQSIQAEFVSGNYFSVFGVQAFAGRPFTASEDRPNAPPVAMMSYRAWQQRYALDRSVIGSVFSINGQPVTVLGVAPPGFYGDTLRADPPDFWFPLSLEPALNGSNSLLNSQNEYWLYSVGRLRPGVQIGPLQSRLTIKVQQWLNSQPGFTANERSQIPKMRLLLSPADAGVTRLRNRYGDGLRLLAVISGLVLLIACGNIANLLLARGLAKRTQTAVSVALGATRGVILRQILTEGMLLALIGGVAGIVVAIASTRLILLLAFRGASYVPITARPSPTILAFAIGLSLITGAVFSGVPAWFAARTHPVEALRGSMRSVSNAASMPQRSLLVVQAALSLVLLVGAGLLTKSLRNLEHQHLGFQSDGRIVVRIDPAQAGYKPEQLYGLYQRLQQQFGQLPGVSSASVALNTPLDHWNWSTAIAVEGHPAASNPDEDNAYYDWVSGRYFETLGIRLLRGRAIDEHDTPSSHHVVVINETLARKFFPNDDPLGKHIGGAPGHAGDYEIVGIVEDTKFRDAKLPPEPMFFVPLLQLATYERPDDRRYQVWANYIDSIQLRFVRTPENLDSLIRRTLAEVDPNLTVIAVRTLEEQVGTSFNSERLIARLSSLYGALALILASVGLYGVAAYTVSRRTNEIGIRMALGANRANVIAMVVQQAISPIGMGLLIGMPLVIAGGHVIASQLFGLKAYDPIVLGTAMTILTIAALAAAMIPARRASAIDPIQALRAE